MKLLEMRVKNFRPFFGEQWLKFAGEGDRNVTVIHGFNGSGKTALLNCFVWCLYDETTPDLEAPERLCNERALAEAKEGEVVEVSVRLSFSHGGERYQVERRRTALRAEGGTPKESKSTLALYIAKPNGEWARFKENEAGASLEVERHLPRDLHQFFFFNGERVERLASPDAYARVEGGIKTLLNIEIFARSSRHLRTWVSGELGKELKQFGNEEMADAVEERERINRDLDASRTQGALFLENISKCETEIETIERRQGGLAELVELTNARAAAKAKLVDANQGIERVSGELARALSRNGYLAFAQPILSAMQTQIAGARQRGDLPSKLKPQFVDDLLGSGTCICGSDIPKGSKAETQLIKWKEASALADLEEAVVSVGARVGSLRARRMEFVLSMGRLLEQKTNLFGKRRSLADELDVLQTKIGGRDVSENAQALEGQRQKVVRQRDEQRFALGEEERKQATLTMSLEDIERRIKKLHTQSEKERVVQRRFDSVVKVADALDKICEIQKQDVRADLTELIGKIWDDAAVKDYVAAVSENFRLTLSKHVGGSLQPVIGASTGEKQILALSFVGSLLEKARRNERRGHEQGMPGALLVGGDYPLVMDSPFGSLEQDYQRKVGEWIPSLASQVVVMVSKSQWTQEVSSVMRAKVGRQFVLELHSPKEESSRMIEIDGTEYPYVVASSEAVEQTEIKEVGRGR